MRVLPNFSFEKSIDWLGLPVLYPKTRTRVSAKVSGTQPVKKGKTLNGNLRQNEELKVR